MQCQTHGSSTPLPEVILYVLLPQNFFYLLRLFHLSYFIYIVNTFVMLGCPTDNFHALQIVWDTYISCFMELKRNSWFKFVLCLRKLSTVIHKFKFRIVILAAVILGFWGKRLVHIFWSWGFWFHKIPQMLCLRMGKTISNCKLSPCLLQWAP